MNNWIRLSGYFLWYFLIIVVDCFFLIYLIVVLILLLLILCSYNWYKILFLFRFLFFFENLLLCDMFDILFLEK